MILGMIAKTIDENNEENRVKLWRIKRLSINIWQIGEEKSLIDYGFEIENLDKNHIEKLEILVPYKVEDIYDITKECYLDDKSIARTIFSKEYKLIDKNKNIMKADGLLSKVLEIDDIYTQSVDGATRIIIEFDKNSLIRNNEYYNKEKIWGAFRVRVLAKNIPKCIIYFPRIKILSHEIFKIHCGYIFDIPIYDIRHESTRIYNDIDFPTIEKLHLFIIPYANLCERKVHLKQNPKSKHSIRLLETKDWKKYLEITKHGKYLEDGRKVYKGDYKHISRINKLRVFCEFEEPYSKVVLKSLSVFFFMVLITLLSGYLIYLNGNYIISGVIIILSWIFALFTQGVFSNFIYDMLKSSLEKITKNNGKFN